jgi:hypothetical protein
VQVEGQHRGKAEEDHQPAQDGPVVPGWSRRSHGCHLRFSVSENEIEADQQEL